MDAVKYIKEFNRMVQLRENGYCKILCNNCPISKAMDEINGKYDGCTGFMRLYPEKAVEIVEQWAKENPVKTYRDDFFEKFPDAGIWKDGNPQTMWCNVYNKGMCTQERRITCGNCPMWDKEIE